MAKGTLITPGPPGVSDTPSSPAAVMAVWALRWMWLRLQALSDGGSCGAESRRDRSPSAASCTPHGPLPKLQRANWAARELFQAVPPRRVWRSAQKARRPRVAPATHLALPAPREDDEMSV